jgi:hypothetical protein
MMRVTITDGRRLRVLYKGGNAPKVLLAKTECGWRGGSKKMIDIDFDNHSG